MAFAGARGIRGVEVSVNGGRLLVQAFLEDAVSEVAHEATREAFRTRIAGWMQA